MQKKGLFVFVFILLLDALSYGQLAAFQDEGGLITPTFNYDIIHTKKVASITIHVEEKPDDKPIYDDGIMQYYRFDSAGRLAESYYTIKESSDSWDTIHSRYYYDKQNRLITKRTYEGSFYDTWYYVWYDNGLLKKEAHVHESVGPGGGADFKIGSQKMISCDSFNYEIYPKQVQRYGYNEQNKLYEKVITQYDNGKHLISRYSHYQVGWLFSQADLVYDSVYRVTGYTYAANLSGEEYKKVHITYDKYSNVISEKIFSRDKQLNDIEFMYDNSTGLISNKLNRDYIKGLIEIDQFTYTFLDSDGVPLFGN